MEQGPGAHGVEPMMLLNKFSCVSLLKEPLGANRCALALVAHDNTLRWGLGGDDQLGFGKHHGILGRCVLDKFVFPVYTALRAESFLCFDYVCRQTGGRGHLATNLCDWGWLGPSMLTVFVLCIGDLTRRC